METTCQSGVVEAYESSGGMPLHGKLSVLAEQRDEMLVKSGARPCFEGVT